jgi:mRNA interferase MazF
LLLPGNLILSAKETGLSKDSVVNLSQLITLDRSQFIEKVGTIPDDLLFSIDEGLRTVLDL